MINQYEFTEEQEAFRQSVRRIAQERIAPRASEMEETGEFPWDIVELFRKHHLWGLGLPEEYGGGGADFLTCCLAAEEVAKVCWVVSGIFTGYAYGLQALVAFGTPHQKEKYLTKIARGESIMALSITEPQAGSDVAAISTKAVLEGDYYTLNGTKRFCTNADIADVVQVYARTAQGPSAFLIDKGTPGFSITKIEKKMGQHAFHTCDIALQDCRVPPENLLGEEGAAFKYAMHELGRGRVMHAARAVGLAQGALDYAADYAKQRVQFGQPIAKFQGIQFMIADMATNIEAARQLTYRAAAVAQRNRKEVVKLASMAKLFATDVAMRAATDAVEILGGYGYIRDYPVERMMREAKLTQITEGTNEIQRVVIARQILGRL